MASGFAALEGFGDDDLPAAFACFRRSAEAIVAGRTELRPALPFADALKRVAREALSLRSVLSQADALSFFGTWFEPTPVATLDEARAFYTGYYEPVVDGALAPGPSHTAPLLARPADLVTFAADASKPDWATDLAAARSAPDGTLTPYPTRAAIEAAIASGLYRPLCWLRDWVEVFLIQVQGSARVRLPDGRTLRVTYAGRNGHPYTSIGRLLVEQGEVAPTLMSLDRLKGWLREHGQDEGEPGRLLMQRNASYVFFDAAVDTTTDGPIGGQGVPLTPLRSIAVDRTLWSYGLPFWIDAMLPWEGPEPTRFRRLMVAQDTGSAILGPARADLYFGTGERAGHLAGGIRHRGELAMLQPRGGVGP